MNPIDPRAQATLDAAMNLIRTAASSAAMRVAENLTHAAQAAVKISERDQLATTQSELRRNLGTFQSAFFESLREKVAKESRRASTRSASSSRPTGRRSAWSTRKRSRSR